MKNPFKNFRNIFLRVSLGDKVLLVKHLSIAVRSGMSLLEGLRMIQKQSPSRSLKRILAVVIEDVNNGMFLSTSLEKFSSVFGDLFVNIVRVGEATGTLTENLNYLSEEMRKRNMLKKKVRGALIYPAIIMSFTIIIAIGMLTFVFPKILSIFQDSKIELPLTTQLLINLSNFLMVYWQYLIVAVFAVMVASWFLLRIKPIKFYFHRLLIVLPVFGNMVKEVNMANISRTLGLLLKSGIKIIEAVTITSDTVVNMVYRQELINAANTAKSGEYLSKYFAMREHLFPPIMANMTAVGENTGNLTENLTYLAEYYEDEVDDFVKNLSSIIEPVLLVVMGFVVGFIALSIITPMYKLTQSVSQ